MLHYFADTDRKTEDLQIKLLRDLPAWKKIKMLSDLNASAHIYAMSGLRSRFPDAGEAELKRRFADLLLGEEQARQLFDNENDAP